MFTWIIKEGNGGEIKQWAAQRREGLNQDSVAFIKTSIPAHVSHMYYVVCMALLQV